MNLLKTEAASLDPLDEVFERAFVATPNRWFPFERHTRLPLIHWLPKSVFRGILLMLGYGFYAQEANLNLLTAEELLELVPEGRRPAAKISYNSFLGFRSNVRLSVG